MTHVTTEDINGVNYISEGFLSRYTFEFVKVGGFWGLLGSIIGAVVLIAATVLTFGAAAPLSAAGLTGIFAGLASAASAVAGATTAIAIGTAVAVGATVAVGAVYEAVTAI
jgi:hypothetical protein